MSTTRQFLKCVDQNHAEVVDEWIMMSLRDRYGNQGTQWSGVYALPGLFKDTFAVAWGHPASTLFGEPRTNENPDGDKDIVVLDDVVDEEGASFWVTLKLEPTEEEI